jgi:SAM-dependent methyltransferase
MSVDHKTDEFGLYSAYYDLLYRDKDYQAEANYVADVLRSFSNDSNKLLELGCGTGIHAELLTQSGFEVVGVERSEEMFKQAQSRARRLEGGTGTLAFRPVLCAAQDFRSDESFDAVVSLFHVVSYQTDDVALGGFLDTVSRHLRPGGLFLFDVWYGPAVLTQRPECRVKRMASESREVIRVAEPTIDTSRNLVQVDYEIFVRESDNAVYRSIREQHRMRYFFATEIAQLARRFGMNVERSEEWLTGKVLSESTWGACFVIKKDSNR